MCVIFLGGATQIVETSGWQVLKLTDEEILNLYHFAQNEVVVQKPKNLVLILDPRFFGERFLGRLFFEGIMDPN